MHKKILALAAAVAIGTATMTTGALAFGHGGGGHGGGFGGGHFGGARVGGFAAPGVAMNGGGHWAGGGHWGRGFDHDHFRRGFGLGGYDGLYAYAPYDYSSGYCDPNDPNAYIYGYCNGFANGQ
jgi:hypothetical protein